ncbi:MAG: hypothetical protein HY820_25155 [Acidobacteria bacterium]|nr:hypothetical protein [Acidobacteriota bacterium]
MVALIGTLIRFASYYSKAKLLASTGEKAATVSRISLQVDNLIRDYGKAKSGSAADKIRAGVNAIKAELESLKRPGDAGMALSAGGAGRKLLDHETDLVVANWAQAELMRIYMEQYLGHLPPDPTPWSAVRTRVIQFRDAWTLFARQLRSAAFKTDKDIASSTQVRAQLRKAWTEPGLTKQDIDLLTQDHERMLREEEVLRRDRDRILKLAQDADAAAEELRSFIELRDALNS